MTMTRPHVWYAAAVVVLVLTAGAACGFASRVNADSTCRDYLSAQADQRHSAAASISADLHAFNAGSPDWGTSLDAECGTAPDATLRTYFAGQLALAMPSVSMERTIKSGDTVLVNTLAYTHAAPRRGEVIVFKAPPSWYSDPSEARFVKRVIATAGDHVVCCDSQGRLMVNGPALDEPYVYRDDSGRPDPAGTHALDIVVPAGRLWVMGDHRSRSGDSAERWLIVHDIVESTISVQSVVGRAFAAVDSHNQNEVHWLTLPSTYAGVPDPRRS
jgi:signal peptidase I